MELNLLMAALALIVALGLRPWRLLVGGTRLTPILATLTLLPWLWAMPSLHRMPLQLQGSGACLVLLMLGWPLATPVLCAVGIIAALISPMPWETALDLTVWLGLVPATLALLLGVAVRRWIGLHLFVYVLTVAHWLIAWGDAFLTGMVAAVLVAYKPDWLATWSDRLYLKSR
ncbi:MAG: hypothetical protein PHH58_02760 [Rhodoferax sp.]|nr:hypothetical protein [Rhodoferax sp.]